MEDRVEDRGEKVIACLRAILREWEREDVLYAGGRPASGNGVAYLRGLRDAYRLVRTDGITLAMAQAEGGEER